MEEDEEDDDISPPPPPPGSPPPPPMYPPGYPAGYPAGYVYSQPTTYTGLKYLMLITNWCYCWNCNYATVKIKIFQQITVTCKKEKNKQLSHKLCVVQEIDKND